MTVGNGMHLLSSMKGGIYFPKHRGKVMSRGISTVISTVILTFTMLIVVLSTSAFVTEVFNVQSENVEFEQAEYVMLTLANSINGIIFKPQSSSYVRTGFRTTMPQLTDTGENMEILIDNNTISTISIRTLSIEGGSKVDASEANLVGEEDLLLTDLSAPLHRIYVARNDKAEVILDYSRIRCVYLGTSQFYNGTGSEIYNVIEITVVRISFGSIRTHNEAIFSIRNMGVEIQQIEKEAGDHTIEVILSDEGENVTLSGLGGNVTYPTLINFQIVNIEVSLVGGS